MKQIARNMTLADYGLLKKYRYLIMDRDSKFCASFRKIIEDSGTKIIRFPPKSPDLNSYAKRWVKSVKDSCLSKLIFFGEEGLKTRPERICRALSRGTESPGNRKCHPASQCAIRFQFSKWRNRLQETSRWPGR